MKTLTIISIIILVNTGFCFSQETQAPSIPLIGDKAPTFTAQTTNGTINFPDDYGRKWKILFSHPADFTPVCSSEILELAADQADFDKLGVKLAVVSTDALENHMSWKKSLETIRYLGREPMKIKFPLIEDQTKQIATSYGMLHENSSSSKDVRGVFIIDPDNKVAAVFFYPMNIGRNIDEIKRTVIALQTAEKHTVLTPANWKPGEDVILPYLSSSTGASDLKKDPDKYEVAWYMWFKKLNEQE